MPYSRTYVVQSLSHVQLCVTPWNATHQASLSFTISWNFHKLMSIESVIPPSCLILCSPFLLLPSVFLSIKVFPKKLAVHIRWPKYWNFSFNISSSNEYSELNSIRIEWFDLLAVQGSLKSLLQHHSLKVSSFHCLLCVHSVMSDSLRPHGLYLARLLCPWDFPGTNTGVGCHSLGAQPSLWSNSYMHIWLLEKL